MKDDDGAGTQTYHYCISGKQPGVSVFLRALPHFPAIILTNVSVMICRTIPTRFRESKVWNKLYTFQKDAVLAISVSWNSITGCILWTASARQDIYCAGRYQILRKPQPARAGALPKKLADNWTTTKRTYVNNPPSRQTGCAMTFIYHTDLSRSGGFSGGTDLLEAELVGLRDLVVIDESHNFTPTAATPTKRARKTASTRLMNKVIRPGARDAGTDAVGNTVNNRFYDLRNQLALAYGEQQQRVGEQTPTHRSVEEIFRNAQKPLMHG